jgi:hypothetical protein
VHGTLAAGVLGAGRDSGVVAPGCPLLIRPVFSDRTAQAGDTGAMYNLGLLLKASHPDQARHW